MEPRIQYAKTSDGVNIACYAMGQGPPVLYIPPVTVNHLQFEWQIPALRELYERAAQRNMYVRYDPRGTGLSDRDVTDFSLTAMVSDLEALDDHLHLDKCRLIAAGSSTIFAIAYAARHPERLSHLVLWSGYARLPESDIRTSEAVIGLVELDWEFASEAIMLGTFGQMQQEPRREWATLMRESVTPETYVAFSRQAREWDATALLSGLTMPTLVAQRRNYPTLGVDVARGLAAAIPNARLALIEGTSVILDAAVNAAIGSFFRETGDQGPPEHELPSGMTAILFADIADSTALTERMGDAAFRVKARELDGALRKIIGESGGRPIEGPTLGDGILATFASARQAIEAALACAAVGNREGLPLHLGLHAGDVIREKDPDGRGNVYGGAVNIASRISGMSAPGEVLVSETVRSLARTSAGVRFEDRGEQALKGVGEAVRVWAVRSFDSSSAAATDGSG